VQGLFCVVVDDAGGSWRCYVRRLLKTVGADARSVLAVGDRVWFRPAPNQEGFIERVEPRATCLVRKYRGREQLVAANVDQALIVAALADPPLKPPLIDRYLARVARSGLRAVVCVNKCDLDDAWRVQPLVGLYAQLGYSVVAASARTGRGIDELRDLLRGRDTVVVGQSGVGKSSLLNALEPAHQLAVGEVSEGTRKGRHTTTTARWLGLAGGGSVIDTPGVRQYALADLDHEDVVAGFPEFAPFLPGCRFGGCTHGEDEAECGVAQAVVDRLVSGSRYDGYLRILDRDDS
jgi:ribosome biogenesis GTPase / thiamine phosphate phosphatase